MFVQVYCVTRIATNSCRMFCKVNYQSTFEYFKMYNVGLSLVFLFMCCRAETFPRVTRIQKIIEANYLPRIIFFVHLLGMH